MGIEFSSSKSHVDVYDKQSTIDTDRVTLSGTRRLQYDTSERHKFHLHRFELEPELLKYIQGASIFTLPETKLEDNGFKAAIDYPTEPNHKYYEGYFHSLPQDEPIHSLNPRYFSSFDKPAAPVELRAFYTAFRKVNDFSSLKAQLHDGLTKKLLEDGWHFADLAVQIHFGDEISGDLLGWHQDTINSRMHLAMAVEGCRGLHLVHTSPGESKDDPVVEHKEYLANRPGDVYFSSPYVFRHAVHYPKTHGFADRIVAVQARFLLTLDTAEAESGSQAIITKWLEEATLRMPTLAEVLEIEKILRDGKDKDSKAEESKF